MEGWTEVVAALIVRGGTFLICKRPRHKARGGLWEFVGGKVEGGETPQAALDRECREELGVGALVGKEYMHVGHVYPDIRIRLTLFYAELLGEPRLLEHEAFAWISPAEVGSYAFCPADEAILKKLSEEGL